ncbi:MAG: hypothetical protein R3F56_21600 [Planctomycetota bacterium]
MLSTEEFAAWSKKVVLFLHNTSRVADEPYPNLLFEKGGIGFPTMSFLADDGTLLKQVGHVTPVAQLEQAYQDLLAWQKLRATVEAGEGGSAAELELFRTELAMGNRPYAEMAERRAKLPIADADAEKVDQQLVNLQFGEILRDTPRDQQHVGGEKFVAMFRAGRLPDTSTETSFWQYIFAHAAREKDTALFEEVLDHLKKAKADDPRLARYLKQLEAQLEKLKGG